MKEKKNIMEKNVTEIEKIDEELNSIWARVSELVNKKKELQGKVNKEKNLKGKYILFPNRGYMFVEDQLFMDDERTKIGGMIVLMGPSFKTNEEGKPYSFEFKRYDTWAVKMFELENVKDKIVELTQEDFYRTLGGYSTFQSENWQLMLETKVSEESKNNGNIF